MKPLRVEELLDEDAEAERRERQEQPGQANGWDGDDRADRHDHQCAEDQRREPRQVVLDGELGEGRRADGSESGVAQGDLTGGAHQQAKRKDDRDLGQADREVAEFRVADDLRDERKRNEHDHAGGGAHRRRVPGTAAVAVARPLPVARVCVSAG